jgi:hypothetical protein
MENCIESQLRYLIASNDHLKTKKLFQTPGKVKALHFRVLTFKEFSLLQTLSALLYKRHKRYRRLACPSISDVI